MGARMQRSPRAAPGRAGLQAAALLSLCVGAAGLRAQGRVARQQTLRVPFMTYNVLAPTLSSKDWFARSEAKVPGSTTAKVRWPKVLRYVQTAMQAGAVIALQEVEASWWPGSVDWLRTPGGLAEVFNANGYAWEWQAGGGANVFMGVMLAWPKARFDGDVHYTDLAAMVPQGGDASFELARKKTRNGKERPLHNNVLVGNLWEKGTGQRMTVATCHMPVLWETPEERRAQAIHMHLAVAYLQYIANGAPAVLLGDFNFMPDSAQYALAANGYGHAARRHKGASGLPLVTRPMRSAYRECFDAEPAFTNNAWASQWDASFVGTLDYIWMGDGVAARECLRLPDEVDGPLPNDLEGSDHVPVVAMLDVGPPTGLVPMPAAGQADIAGTFQELVQKWNSLAYRRAGRKSSDESLKSMRTLSTADTLSPVQSPEASQLWDEDFPPLKV